MRRIKFIDISPCLRLGFLAFVYAGAVACSADTVPVITSSIEAVEQQNEPVVKIESHHESQKDAIKFGGDVDNITVPGQGFFRALLSLNKGAMGEGTLNLHMPAIWVFSPQGDLARIVQDDQGLEAFQSEFSLIDSQAPNITCQTLEQAVVNVAEEAWNMGCANGKWITLLLVGPAQCGASCAKYKNAQEQAGQAHHDTLQVKTLLVDLRS